jgi:hypothetical protein
VKKLFTILSLLSASILIAQPANDDCADAIALTINAGLTCGQTATDATAEGGECLTNWAGNGNSTVWYSFTANNDSLVLSYIETVLDGEMLAIYGPGAACQPACATQVYEEQQVGDPGHHILVTGLTVGGTYLIQIDATNPNAPNNPSDLEFCIGIDEPASNGLSTNATLIDECGTIFTETTDGGYWNSGTGASFADLDSTAGNDVGFVINNFAWNTFCSLTSGSWQITVDGVSNCNVTAPNDGIQAAVFSGTQAALVLEDSQSPINPGDTWTSAIITVDSAECAYLGIDGFAGDVCDYQITLTNITGGCTILPIQFMGFSAIRNDGHISLSWLTLTEIANRHFTIERSNNGDFYEEIGTVISIGDHYQAHTYQFSDLQAPRGNVYYRLSEVSDEGVKSVLAVKYLKGNPESDYFNVYPNPAQEAINVEFTQVQPELITLIEVYNYQGQKVLSESLETLHGFNSIQLQLGDLPAQNYMLRVINSEKTFSSRITLED